jgi:anti-anti-sigma regulatory factor
LDCSKLTFIDSLGLRAILGFASTVPDGVVLRDAPWDVRVVFNLAGVDEAAGVRIELST